MSPSRSSHRIESRIAMSMTSPRLLLLPPVLALVAGGVCLAHCIDGATPNCSSPDAGCGPGDAGGADAQDAATDGDAGEAGHGPTDARADAPKETGAADASGG